ncbi:CelD/BcsL family acetyltransferase involved in cellulose biosynthesis [Methylobacterium sp. PvR107]|nr:CelD/BcsL family acetyltransferase involved in cellulose biosynthesis [Methylobacterium sp. PvR107]
MTRQEHWSLWRRDPRATPFQSTARLEAWWMHLGSGERLDAAVRDPAGDLVAVLPLFVWHEAGHSDCCDALVAPGAPMDRLWSAILATADRWDALLLPDLRVDSPLLRPVPEGWQACDAEAEICPVPTLLGAGSPLAALTGTQRRKVVHDRHRAARIGGVTEALATPAEVGPALFALHAVRRAAALVAVLDGLADPRAGYSSINAADMSVPGQSFGTLAFACLIAAAAAAGAAESDFLRGEEPYKYRWGAEPRRTVRRVGERIFWRRTGDHFGGNALWIPFEQAGHDGLDVVGDVGGAAHLAEAAAGHRAEGVEARLRRARRSEHAAAAIDGEPEPDRVEARGAVGEQGRHQRVSRDVALRPGAEHHRVEQVARRRAARPQFRLQAAIGGQRQAGHRRPLH